MAVLRIDPRRALFPMLATWPVPSPSGESLLWRQVGDRVVNVSDARQLPESAGRFSQPWATAGLPLARVLRNEVKAGLPMEAVDYRGAGVLAIERALRDSEAHFRTVVSVLNEGVLVSDPQGTVLSCNPAAERIVGVPQPDWQGRPVIAPGWTLMRPDGSLMPPEESPPGKVLAGAPAQRAPCCCRRSVRPAIRSGSRSAPCP